MKYRITESKLRSMIREAVKSVLKESAAPQDEVIDMDEEQLEKVQDILMQEDPGSLYGGGALEGKIKLHYEERGEDEMFVTGTVYLLVNGDFDEDFDNGKPKWIRFKLANGLPLYRYDSDETDAYGNPTYEWDVPNVYHSTPTSKIIRMFLDFEQLY